MENLRSLEPQAKISHSYKKKDCTAKQLNCKDIKSNDKKESNELFYHIHAANIF